jgi:hypothetical protein
MNRLPIIAESSRPGSPHLGRLGAFFDVMASGAHKTGISNYRETPVVRRGIFVVCDLCTTAGERRPNIAYNLTRHAQPARKNSGMIVATNQSHLFHADQHNLKKFSHDVPTALHQNHPDLRRHRLVGHRVDRMCHRQSHRARAAADRRREIRWLESVRGLPRRQDRSSCFVQPRTPRDLRFKSWQHRLRGLSRPGQLSDAEACKKLVRRALERFSLPYITITPTFSICPKHGYLSGEHKFCPKCDEDLIQQKREAAAGLN